MKTRKVGYWATTGLIAFAFATGGLLDVVGAPAVTAGMAHLGYPAYFATLLGAWKVLGAAAVLVPRFPRLKEWAYAGMFFDLSGAAFSHATVGDDVGKVMTPIVLCALLLASWMLRPSSRALASTTPTSSSSRSPVAADATLAEPA